MNNVSRNYQPTRLLVTANVVHSSLVLLTLMMEALSSSETSVCRRSTLRNIPEDAILHSHRRENLKPYFRIKFPFTLYTCIRANGVTSILCGRVVA
jgi:hypothetical protein